ncbi:hypothetical protein DERP_008347, partial [Dermatophagoides pteronyssinus]
MVIDWYGIDPIAVHYRYDDLDRQMPIGLSRVSIENNLVGELGNEKQCIRLRSTTNKRSRRVFNESTRLANYYQQILAVDHRQQLLLDLCD